MNRDEKLVQLLQATVTQAIKKNKNIEKGKIQIKTTILLAIALITAGTIVSSLVQYNDYQYLKTEYVKLKKNNSDSQQLSDNFANYQISNETNAPPFDCQGLRSSAAGVEICGFGI